jgi:hypothetical protein
MRSGCAIAEVASLGIVVKGSVSELTRARCFDPNRSTLVCHHPTATAKAPITNQTAAHSPSDRSKIKIRDAARSSRG